MTDQEEHTEPLPQPRFISDGEVEPQPLRSQIPAENFLEASPAPSAPWEPMPGYIELVLLVGLTGGAIAVLWGCWELGRVFYHWLVR